MITSTTQMAKAYQAAVTDLISSAKYKAELDKRLGNVTFPLKLNMVPITSNTYQYNTPFIIGSYITIEGEPERYRVALLVPKAGDAPDAFNLVIGVDYATGTGYDLMDQDMFPVTSATLATPYEHDAMTTDTDPHLGDLLIDTIIAYQTSYK